VEQFYNREFKGHFVIGVHYRGTDKATEAPRVHYDEVSKDLRSYIKRHAAKNFRIFVASDEQRFIEYMQMIFPERVIFIPCERSRGSSPLHYSTKHPYEQGESAVVDAILLSKTQVLFRTSSNLSLWSSFMNPKLPIVMLNDRFPYILNHP
jgi:hypothetical protein